MITWLLRLLVLRILPRRLIPVLTVLDVVRFLRGRRRGAPSEAMRPRPAEAREARARVRR